MDYPFIRRDSGRGRDLGRDREDKSKTLRKSPLIFYLDEVGRNDKFKYIVIVLVVILLFYRLDLHWSIWIGLIVGLLVIYYMNERRALELNTATDQLWTVLKSPLLQKTKYFITDPQLIQWVQEVSELKGYNVLEFNKMVKSLDGFLKLTHEMKIGVSRCSANLDLIHDFKSQCLNQFHSLVYNIDNADVRSKYNTYLERLGYLLNDRDAELTRICQTHALLNPINIDSQMAVNGLDEPKPNDPRNEGNYNYYV
jgi:hypothetical protein